MSPGGAATLERPTGQEDRKEELVAVAQAGLLEQNAGLSDQEIVARVQAGELALYARAGR